MTGEEMERAIEFLLQSQASSESRIGRLEAAQEETNRQLAETGRQIAEAGQQLAVTNRLIDSFADTQAALMRVATETFAAQNRINEDMRIGVEQLRLAQESAWETINRLGERQDRTEASVERLAETVRRHLEGGNGDTRG
jgi:septal ring factor EnvC (AmiA/AmiB activator)